MGCLGSKEDKRRGELEENFTGCEYAFTPGSVKDLQAFCPLDWIVAKWVGDKKELKDKIGEWPITEEKVKEISGEIWTSMKEFHALLAKTKDGDKAGAVFGKYTGKEAFEQMEAVMTTFAANSELGLKWPEEEAAAAEKPAGMEGMEGEMAAMDGEMMAEGGEMMEGEMAAMEGMAMEAMAAKMSLIAPDAFGEAKGAAEVPKLLLSLMFTQPVFGDAVKSATMTFDLGGDKGVANFAGIAAVVGAYVNAGEKAEADSFGAAWLTGVDMEELQEVAAQKEAKALVFPGIVGAWSDQADALSQLCPADGKTKVLFKFKGKVLKPAGDKLHVFCRQFAKVESLEAPAEGTDYHVCTLSDYTEHVYETVAAWSEAVGKLTAVVAEAKEAAEGKMEENMMMAAGEGMLDPPAQGA